MLMDLGEATKLGHEYLLYSSMVVDVDCGRFIRVNKRNVCIYDGQILLIDLDVKITATIMMLLTNEGL